MFTYVSEHASTSTCMRLLASWQKLMQAPKKMHPECSIQSAVSSSPTHMAHVRPAHWAAGIALSTATDAVKNHNYSNDYTLRRSPGAACAIPDFACARIWLISVANLAALRDLSAAQGFCRTPVGPLHSKKDCSALGKLAATARQPAKRINRRCNASSTATPAQVERSTSDCA